MFNLIKFGLHFSHAFYGALDPMVFELIRTERMMRRQNEPKCVAEPATADCNPGHEDEEVRKAA